MYSWLVFFHVLGTFAFLFGHGVSAMVALRLRYVRNLEQVRALLDLSMYALGVLYVSILLLLITGVWAGFKGGWWDKGWIWASLGILLAIIDSLVKTRFEEAPAI